MNIFGSDTEIDYKDRSSGIGTSYEDIGLVKNVTDLDLSSDFVFVD